MTGSLMFLDFDVSDVIEMEDLYDLSVRRSERAHWKLHLLRQNGWSLEIIRMVQTLSQDCTMCSIASGEQRNSCVDRVQKDASHCFCHVHTAFCPNLLTGLLYLHPLYQSSQNTSLWLNPFKSFLLIAISSCPLPNTPLSPHISCLMCISPLIVFVLGNSFDYIFVLGYIFASYQKFSIWC